jgi:proteasome lid subunit RPN8/RPN11
MMVVRSRLVRRRPAARRALRAYREGSEVPCMWSSPRTVVILYSLSAVALTGAFQARIPPPGKAVRPLDRALGRGEVAPGVPRLDPDDPMANAAILTEGLAQSRACSTAPRAFMVHLAGRTRRVRVPSPIVCQLQTLKAISIAQPGFGSRGLAELAAFLLARPIGDDTAIELTRIVIPPFHFTRDTITFLDADLGALAPGEVLVGTYHTHPDDDLSEGLLSLTDLRYMRLGHIDFHGAIGWLARPHGGLDWIFDIVDPRDGAWNVFAHDAARLEAVRTSCEPRGAPGCRLDDLRIAGSPYYLLVRTYEEHTADAGGY